MLYDCFIDFKWLKITIDLGCAIRRLSAVRCLWMTVVSTLKKVNAGTAMVMGKNSCILRKSINDIYLYDNNTLTCGPLL